MFEYSRQILYLGIVSFSALSCSGGDGGFNPTSIQPKVILHTPNGETEYDTIQDAIDVSSNGDIIVLTDGIFRGEGNRDGN